MQTGSMRPTPVSALGHHAAGGSAINELRVPGENRLALVAQLFDAELGSAAVQDAQHHLFAEQCRKGADAEVDLLGLAQVELDAPILRHALFRDIQPRHYL